MTNERRYTNALYMLERWENAAMNSDELTRAVEKDPRKWINAAAFPVAAAAAEIMVEALDNMAKSKAGAGAVNVAKRVYQENEPCRARLAGIFESGGKWTVCDGYRAIMFNDDMPELPHVDGGSLAKSLPDMIYKAEKLEPLELPTVAELKAWAAAHGGKKALSAGKAKPYIWGGVVGVNVYYLIDMLQALENCRAYLPESKNSAIYFSGDNGDGILLPVRVAETNPAFDEISAFWEERRNARRIA